MTGRSNTSPLSSVLLALALGGLVLTLSCQSSSSGPDPEPLGKQTLTLPFSVADYKRPDSGSWVLRRETGRAALQLGNGLIHAASVETPGPLGSDTLWLGLWAAGMREMQVPFVWDGTKVGAAATERVTYDSLALEILKKIDTLKGTANHPTNRDEATSIVANWILTTDRRVSSFPTSLPTGLDTNAIFDSVVSRAGRSIATFAEVASHWSLAKDSTWVRARVAKLIAAGQLTGTDSLNLFPPFPLRLESPLRVADSLLPGGAAIALQGLLACDSGNLSVTWKIERAGTTATGFVIDQPNTPPSSATHWDLGSDGQVRLLASSAVDTGAYLLTMAASDGKRTFSATTSLRVGRPPVTHSLDSLLLPLRRVGNQLPWDSATAHSIWRVSGLAPRDSFQATCQGKPALALDDSTVVCAIDLPPDGMLRWYAVHFATHGATWTDSVQLARSPDLDPPQARIVPATRTLIGTDSLQVSCIAFDRQRLDSVYIDGKPIAGNGGNYTTTLRGIHGTTREVSCIAVDASKNRDTSSFVVLRDTIPPTIQLVSNNPDTLWTTNETAKLDFKISDESGVDSFTCPKDAPSPQALHDGIATILLSVGPWGSGGAYFFTKDRFGNTAYKSVWAINVYRHMRLKTFDPPFRTLYPSSDLQDSALQYVVMPTTRLRFGSFFEARMGYGDTCKICRIHTDLGTPEPLAQGYALSLPSPEINQTKMVHLYGIDSAGQTDTLIVKILRLALEAGIDVSKGSYIMGCEGQTDCSIEENPVRRISVSTFHMDSVAVNQAFFEAVLGVQKVIPNSYPTFAANVPVRVPHDSALLFCNARSRAEGRLPIYSFTVGANGQLASVQADLSRDGYRLPTEAEWEYAYRAGSTGSYPWGQDSLGGEAFSCFGKGLCAVDAGKANTIGMRGMAGNTREWVQDWYGSYDPAQTTDPQGPVTGTQRVTRGSDNTDSRLFARSTSRRPGSPNEPHAFRCVRNK